MGLFVKMGSIEGLILIANLIFAIGWLFGRRQGKR